MFVTLKVQQQLMDIVTAKTQALTDQAPTVIASLAEFTDGLSMEQKQSMIETLEKRMNRHGRWSHHGDEH